MARYGPCCQLAISAGRHEFANATSASRVSAVRVGSPVQASALATAVGASSVASYLGMLHGSNWMSRMVSATICERPRQVEVFSHDESSQPETFGGWNRCWPARSPSHDQD